MPKLKQPTSLQKMALEVLHEFVLHYCDQLSNKRSSDELRKGVSIIKEHVCKYIPWFLLADFCNRFLVEFYEKKRLVSDMKAASEILMDIEIIGLRCNAPILVLSHPEDTHRFKKLAELDLEYLPYTSRLILNNLRLDDLETFIFPKNCSDRDLMVIGRNCSKLQVLKVRKSKVTDEGLRALSLCSELRVVDVSDCLAVSLVGLNGLLSTHKKLEELVRWDGTYRPDRRNNLSHLDLVVYPSINRFHFANDLRDVRPLNLEAIVAKFPNLNYLKLFCEIKADLSTLKSLKKLAGLEIHFSEYISYDDIEQTWASLRELLKFIGANVTTLKLSACWNHRFFWNPEELDFIFQYCPNIEHLAFDQGGGRVVIPPFPKLKELYLRISDNPALEFSKLPNLETLSIINYEMNLQAIESIMLDDAKFPNLSVIETNCVKDEDLAHIERTARTKNLDFKVKNYPKSSFSVRRR